MNNYIFRLFCLKLKQSKLLKCKICIIIIKKYYNYKINVEIISNLHITLLICCFVCLFHSSILVCFVTSIKRKHCISNSRDFSIPPTDGQTNLQQSIQNNTERFVYHQTSPQSTPIVTDTLRFEAL